jgi:hypothetical protein
MIDKFEDVEKSAEPEDKTFFEKIEEATGGMHKPVPLAGDQQDSNFEGIESSQVAERD